MTDPRALVPDALSAHQLTVETVLGGEDVEPSSARERAALDWAYAIEWDGEAADDLWRRLHDNFTKPELVELGYAIAYTMGQLHWLRTTGER